MPSTYSPNIRLQLMADGEDNTTWGDNTNENLQLIEQAVTGYTTVTLVGTTQTLTTANGATDQAREAIVNFAGTPGGNCTLTIPAVSKQYVMWNQSTGGFNLVVTTGSGATLTIPNGDRMVLFCDGVNVYESLNYTQAVPGNGTITPAILSTGHPTWDAGGNLTVTGNISGNFTGNATGLTPGGTISITGDMAYTSPTFVGANITAAGTLATVNSTTGTFGDSTHVPQLTVNGKGLITAVTSVAISGGAGGGVTAFNTRTGNVTLASSDVTTALTYTPVNAAASTAFAANVQTTPVGVTFSASAMTMNCTLSNVFTTTFTANVTSAPSISSPSDGQTINWFITQDGTGSRSITGHWPTSFKWPGGTKGVLSTTAGAVDLLVGTYRASTSSWYVNLLNAFS